MAFKKNKNFDLREVTYAVGNYRKFIHADKTIYRDYRYSIEGEIVGEVLIVQWRSAADDSIKTLWQPRVPGAGFIGNKDTRKEAEEAVESYLLPDKGAAGDEMEGR